MPLNEAHACRKHAQDFSRSLQIKCPSEFEAFSLEWPALGKAKRAGSRAIGDLIDRLNDGCDEKRGAELEAASDAIASIVQQTDTEMDARTELGNRSPRPNPMLAKIPICGDRTAPALDNGYCDAAEDIAAYSLRSSVTFKAWAQPRVTEQFNGLSVGSYFRSMISGCQNEQEARALSDGTNSAGGFTVPSILYPTLIDKLRLIQVPLFATSQRQSSKAI